MSTDYLQLFITHRVGTQCVKFPFPATGIDQVQRYPHVIISCQDIVYKKIQETAHLATWANETVQDP